MRRISLDNGVVAVDIHPECGGGIGALRLPGNNRPVDLLLPASEDDIASGTVDRMACLPVAPFAGTPAGGNFRFQGQTYAVAVAGPAGGLPSPRWVAQDASDIRATLTLFHEAGTDGWPWTYQLLQRIELVERDIRIYLAMTNVGTQAMPGGIGLVLNVARRRGVTLSGTGFDRVEFAPEPQVAAHDFNVRFDAPDGRAQLVWTSEPQLLELTADAAFSYMSVAPAQGGAAVRMLLSSNPVTPGDLACDGETGTTLLEQGDTLAGAVLLTVAGDAADTNN